MLVTKDVAVYRPRIGFTLVELLVVIGVIGVLVNLALPAVQMAREAARRMQCQSQIRQLGIAVQSHEGTYRYYPGNGGYTTRSKITSRLGTIEEISTDDFEAGLLYRWGIGKPGLIPTAQSVSWTYSTLPFIEQSEIYINDKVESIGYNESGGEVIADELTTRKTVVSQMDVALNRMYCD